MRSPPRSPWIPALLAALVVLGTGTRPARGDDKPGAKSQPGALTVEAIWKGPSKLKPLPWIAGWWPGKDSWLEWRADPTRGEKAPQALWEIDAASGRATRIASPADFSRTPETGERRAVPMRGIGRAGPPSFLWTPDGKTLVLPVDGDLYRLDFTSGERRRLTTTRSPMADPRLSPDGRKVSFTRDHDLFAAVVDGDATREVRLTSDGTEDLGNGELDWVYPEELDCDTAAWWSPDSARLAFLRLDETKVPKVPITDPAPIHGSVRWQRYPKAGDPNPVPSIGVVGLDGKPPVWLDLGKDPEIYVPWACWWPDGSKVGVAVENRAQTRFDLLTFDPAGGRGTPFWTEEDARWVDVPDAPRFLAKAPAMLVRSRKDGFWRVYRVPLDGGEAKALTPAKREAGRLLAVDEDAGTFFVEGPSEDGLRTVVWRGKLSGGDVSSPSPDAEWDHRASFSTTGRVFVDSRSKAATPPHVEVRGADFSTVRDLADASTPEWAALDLVEPEFTKVPGADKTDLPAVLWKPKPFDSSRKWAVLVEVYGGPGSRTVRDSFSERGLLWRTLLSEQGILSFSIDGRGTGGRGKEFEACVHRRLGACETEDQVRGAQWLGKRKGIDGSRLAISGWSYGGFMAAYAMTKSPGTFAAGIAGAPVTDWRLYDTIYTERYMDLPSENAAGYDASAPTGAAKDMRGALLLAHGLLDDNVHLQNTVRLTDALIHAGADFEEAVYPGSAHGLSGVDAQVDFHRRVLDFLRRRLRLPSGR